MNQLLETYLTLCDAQSRDYPTFELANKIHVARTEINRARCQRLKRFSLAQLRARLAKPISAFENEAIYLEIEIREALKG